MKFISSHHRFGLWWLRYLCSCSLQSIFLSLVELLPFPWIRRCLTLVCRAEGVGAIVGWSVFPLFTLSSGSLLSSVVVFPFSWFCRLFLVCRAREMAEMAAILIHVHLRLSFHLWLKLFPSRESAVAHLPRLPCRKILATVIGIRCESAVPRRWWTVIFFSSGGLLFDSSGVFHPFKGCSNGLHLFKMRLLFTHNRLFLMTIGPYSRLIPLK